MIPHPHRVLMSTRSRILLALLALTLAPLIGVAGWACLHALRWSPQAVELRLAEAAVAGAAEVGARRAEAGAALEALGQEIRDGVAGRALDSAGIAAIVAGWPGLSDFSTIEVATGDVRAVIANRSAGGAGCPVAGSHPPVEAIAGPVRLRAVPVIAGAATGVAADAPRLVLVDERGVPIADPSCAAAAGLLPEGAHVLGSPYAFPAPLSGGELAVVALPAPAWPPPFPDSGFTLLVSALFVGVAAAGAFVILVRDLWRSMEVLTAAADRIGQGDFSPWLPPPTRDEVGRLSFAIGAMAARLEQVMQQNARNRQMVALGELASHVSHEIRNPLSSIKLNLQSIERETRDGSAPADLPEVVRLCLRETNRLEGTVRGVLRLAGTGAPILAPCAVHDVVRDALETVKPQYETRGTIVELDLGAVSDEVRGDAVQLRGVVLNLLLNAHDAMRSTGGLLAIRSEVAGDGANGQVLRVRFIDDGPGVPPEDRERIFQPFYTTKQTGTGIGLPLAARVIEAHGGRLYLERSSELTRGAEFVMELPLAGMIEEPGNGGGGRATRAARDERAPRSIAETVG